MTFSYQTISFDDVWISPRNVNEVFNFVSFSILDLPHLGIFSDMYRFILTGNNSYLFSAILEIEVLAPWISYLRNLSLEPTIGEISVVDRSILIRNSSKFTLRRTSTDIIKLGMKCYIPNFFKQSVKINWGKHLSIATRNAIVRKPENYNMSIGQAKTW